MNPRIQWKAIVETPKSTIEPSLHWSTINRGRGTGNCMTHRRSRPFRRNANKGHLLICKFFSPAGTRTKWSCRHTFILIPQPSDLIGWKESHRRSLSPGSPVTRRDRISFDGCQTDNFFDITSLIIFARATICRENKKNKHSQEQPPLCEQAFLSFLKSIIIHSPFLAYFEISNWTKHSTMMSTSSILTSSVRSSISKVAGRSLASRSLSTNCEAAQRLRTALADYQREK